MTKISVIFFIAVNLYIVAFAQVGEKNGSRRMLVRIKGGIGESISSDAGKTWTSIIFSEIKELNILFK